MKKIVTITALILALLLVMLAGCGDPYSGNYKEPTEEQAQELSAKLDALVANEEKISTKTVGEASFSEKNLSYKVKFTNICDYSEDGKLKSYNKLEMKYQERSYNYALEKVVNRSMEIFMEAWYDEASGKLFAEYDYRAVYDGNLMPNDSGYAKGTASDVNIDDVDYMTRINILPSQVYPIPDRWEVDGNKIRIKLPYAASGNDTTQYIIIESDTEFKTKTEVRLSYKSQTERYEPFEGPIKSTIETVSTKDKVSLPNEQKYSGEIDISELSRNYSAAYYYFR